MLSHLVVKRSQERDEIIVDFDIWLLSVLEKKTKRMVDFDTLKFSHTGLSSVLEKKTKRMVDFDTLKVSHTGLSSILKRKTK